MFFLIPIVAGAAAYGMATADHSGSFSSGQGDRKIDCYQIWDQITHGQGAGSIDDAQQAANRLKGNYDQRVQAIDSISKDMDEAWRGDSGTAAQNSGAHPLKAWMSDSGTKLADSDKYLGEQQTAFTTVKAKVQQVPQQPPQNNFLNEITPWTTDTDRSIRDYNQKGQANVDAYNEYVKSSGTNAKGLPTYSQLDGSVGDVNVNGGGGDPNKPGGDPNQPGGPSQPGGGTPPGGTPNVPGGSYPPGSTPGIPGGGYPPGGTPQVPGGSYPPGGTPGVPGGNYPGGGYQPGGVPNIPGYDGSTRAAGFTPGPIPGADFSGGGFGPGGGGGFGVGDTGAGGFGPGSAGGFGPGGTGGAGSGSGSGAAGAGSGAAGRGGAGTGAGGAGAGGKTGAGGMSGMGGMGGAGKGKGGEDDERQAKFLVGDDPNEIFGTDELTAPPVIGE
jgi:hypothetical protein